MKKTSLLCLSSLLLLSACGTVAPSSSAAPGQSQQQTTSHPTGVSVPETSQNTQGPEATSNPPAQSTSKSSLPQIDYVKVFCEKTWTHVYAWKGVGGNAEKLVGDWPGSELQNYDDNWKTYDFRGETSFNIIFNAGQNGRQTSDLKITSAGYWWYYQNQWYNEDPLAGGSSEASSEPVTSQGSQASIPPSQVAGNYRTWYQLLVYSFADGDGDGIGDFKGIVDHLDYLKNLGIGGLWLSPIHNSGSYHSYDVDDYKSVKYVYEKAGVTFEQLVAKCHEKGIKVIMDMVFNHTSNNNPWRANPSWYTGEHIFDGSMPDLNYDNPEVRAAVKDVGKYWLAKGVDGFRCDAAAWIYGGSGWKINENDYSKTRAWWTEWAAEMKKAKSDVYLVGEVFTDLQYIEQFYETKMGAFNFSAQGWIKDAIQSGDAEHKWVSEVVNHQQHVRSRDPNGIEASFISNHDQPSRYAMKYGGSETDLKLANALNVLSPGGSYVYYGDELGMTGSTDGGWDDMSYRTHMPFAQGQTRGQSYYGKTSYSNTKSGKNADEDAANFNSIYGYTRRVIGVKNANPTLYSGTASTLNTGSSQLAGLKMVGQDDTFIVLVNASGDSKTATITGNYELVGDLATSGNVVDNDGQLQIPAKSIAIVKGDVTVSVN